MKQTPAQETGAGGDRCSHCFPWPAAERASAGAGRVCVRGCSCHQTGWSNAGSGAISLQCPSSSPAWSQVLSHCSRHDHRGNQ